MSWAYRIHTGCEADQPCFALREQGPARSQICNGATRYQVDAVNQDTGEIRSKRACTNHAAWIAYQVGHHFPIQNPRSISRSVSRRIVKGIKV